MGRILILFQLTFISYFLRRWSEIATVIPSDYLAPLCLGWNKRNNGLFKQKEHTLFQLLEKVKYYYLWWLKLRKSFLFLVLICGGQVRCCVLVSAELFLYSGSNIVNFSDLFDTCDFSNSNSNIHCKFLL